MKRGLIVVALVLFSVSVFAQAIPTIVCTDPDATTAPSVIVKCTVTHPLNQIVKVCYQDQCKDVSTVVPIEVPVMISPLLSGAHEYTIDVFSRSGNGTGVVTIEKETIPSVKLTDISYPESISYGEDFELKFSLVAESRSKPRFAKVWVRDNMIFETERLDKVALTTVVDSGLLYEPLPVRVTFEDEQKSPYEMDFSIDIPIENPSFLDKISLFFRRLLSR